MKFNIEIHEGQDYFGITFNKKSYEVSMKTGRLIKLLLLSIRSVLKE